MDGRDDSITEKRVYGERSGRVTLLVAAAVGVVAVHVAADRVGGYRVEHRCTPHDIAGSAAGTAVATDEDLLFGEGFEPTGFGPAVATSVLDGTPVAAGPDGSLARLDGSWEPVGVAEAGVNAIDADLLAGDDGVYRIDDGLQYVGLSAVRDVAAAGPLAATADGLYALGNGWMDVLDGDFHVVASDGERAHAATAAALYERRETGWRAVSIPVDEPIVDVAYVECPYAVTADGTLLAAAGDDDWRSYPLGVSGVVAMAVLG